MGRSVLSFSSLLSVLRLVLLLMLFCLIRFVYLFFSLYMFVCLFVRFIFAVILRAGDRWTTRVCSREASLRPRLSLNPGCQMFVLVRARTPRVYAAARGVHAARALSVRSPRTALEGSVRVHRVYIVYISSGGKLRCVESNSMVENVPVCVRVCECVGISMCMLIYVYVYVCSVRLCVHACVCVCVCMGAW